MRSPRFPRRASIERHPRTAATRISAPFYFPLDATVRRLLRERIMRCVPFASKFTFFMFCPTGNSTDCPLPP
jgi:hypothetical protein